MSSDTATRQQAASGYIVRGLAPIPVPSGSKNPNRPGWQDERFTADDVSRLWTNGQNVGVLLGKPSGWRVDVDLDSDEAVRAADLILPPTLASGRESRPRSHRWYVSPGAASRDWKDPSGDKLVELRSTGRQTLVWPSTHPDGDAYLWDRAGGTEMAEIVGGDLTERLRELATAALIARHVPPVGGRHDFALALSGFLLRPGRLEPELALKILGAAWHAAGAATREAERDLEGIARDTAGRLRAGEPVVGGTTLAEYAPGIVRVLCKWWDWDTRESEAASETGLRQTPPGVLLSEVVPERVRWLWEGRIALGKLNLVDGDPGTGKSAMTTDLAARVSVGRSWPDGSECRAGGVVILSAEDGLADTIRPRFDAAGGDPARAVALSTVPDSEGNERQLSIPDDLGVIEAAIERVGAVLVVVDPLMAFLSGETNSHRDQDVRRALAPLARLAEKTGAAVVVVRHLNKAAGGNVLYRGGGSIGIVGAARSGLLVAKHPEDDGRRVLASIKSNLAAPAPSLVFSLEPSENGAVQVNWRGESSLDASALLSAPTDPEERSALEEAQAFLRDILTDGSVPAKDAETEGRQAGIEPRTLKRAKQKLDIVSERQGGIGERGSWHWRLPTSGSLDGYRNTKGTKLNDGPLSVGVDHVGAENTAYSSQERAAALRRPSTDAAKETDRHGPLSQPPRSEDVRKLLSNPPGWLSDQMRHARTQGFPKDQLQALAAAVTSELAGASTRGAEVLPTVEAFLTHGIVCDCEECL